MYIFSQVSQHTKSEGLNESIGPGVDANILAQKMNQLGTGVSNLAVIVLMQLTVIVHVGCNFQNKSIIFTFSSIVPEH